MPRTLLDKKTAIHRVKQTQLTIELQYSAHANGREYFAGAVRIVWIAGLLLRLLPWLNKAIGAHVIQFLLKISYNIAQY